MRHTKKKVTQPVKKSTTKASAKKKTAPKKKHTPKPKPAPKRDGNKKKAKSKKQTFRYLISQIKLPLQLVVNYTCAQQDSLEVMIVLANKEGDDFHFVHSSGFNMNGMMLYIHAAHEEFVSSENNSAKRKGWKKEKGTRAQA